MDDSMDDLLSGVVVVDADSAGMLQLETETVCLSPNSDATLVVRNAVQDIEKRFLVSTSVLRLASKYFDHLFFGYLAEAHATRRGTAPSIVLVDDDIHAAELILRVLHHCLQDDSSTKDLDLIANVAILCDKYDICTVLEPWISQWLNRLQPIESSPTNLGLLLLITRRLPTSARFSSMCALASKELPPGFEILWNMQELLRTIPRSLK
ncbi:hypothetical protein LTS12_025870, partial [Elasticomyces elasticus]